MPDWFQAALDTLPAILSFIVLFLYLIVPIISGFLVHRYRVSLKRLEGELDSEKHRRETGRLEMKSQMSEAETKAAERALELQQKHEREMAELRNTAAMQEAQQVFSKKLLEHLSEMSAQNREQHASFIDSNKEMIGAIHAFGDKNMEVASRMEAAVARDSHQLHATLDELPLNISKVLEKTMTPVFTEFVSSKASDVGQVVKSAVDEHEARAQKRHGDLRDKVSQLEERLALLEAEMNGVQHDPG